MGELFSRPERIPFLQAVLRPPPGLLENTFDGVSLSMEEHYAAVRRLDRSAVVNDPQRTAVRFVEYADRTLAAIRGMRTLGHRGPGGTIPPDVSNAASIVYHRIRYRRWSVLRYLLRAIVETRLQVIGLESDVRRHLDRYNDLTSSVRRMPTSPALITEVDRFARQTWAAIDGVHRNYDRTSPPEETLIPDTHAVNAHSSVFRVLHALLLHLREDMETMRDHEERSARRRVPPPRPQPTVTTWTDPTPTVAVSAPTVFPVVAPAAPPTVPRANPPVPTPTPPTSTKAVAPRTMRAPIVVAVVDEEEGKGPWAGEVDSTAADRKGGLSTAEPCVVCLDRLRVPRLPCGHKCMCATCTASVERCPLCRDNFDPSEVAWIDPSPLSFVQRVTPITELS